MDEKLNAADIPTLKKVQAIAEKWMARETQSVEEEVLAIYAGWLKKFCEHALQVIEIQQIKIRQRDEDGY